MTVLKCNRKGCGNIMCNRLSREHGYICEECFNDLVNLGYKADIKTFMESEKEDPINQEFALTIFNRIFILT